MPTSLHELAQDRNPGDVLIPRGEQVGGWELYDEDEPNPTRDMWVTKMPEKWRVQRDPHTNGATNRPPSGWFHWYWRLQNTETMTGAHAYRGSAILHSIRPDAYDPTLGFKVGILHQSNDRNMLLMVQVGGHAMLWKEDLDGKDRVVAKKAMQVLLQHPFDWSIETDGDGLFVCKVKFHGRTGVEFRFDDPNPIPSGTAHYRLDRCHASIFADAFDT